MAEQHGRNPVQPAPEEQPIPVQGLPISNLEATASRLGAKIKYGTGIQGNSHFLIRLSELIAFKRVLRV